MEVDLGVEEVDVDDKHEQLCFSEIGESHRRYSNATFYWILYWIKHLAGVDKRIEHMHYSS